MAPPVTFPSLKRALGFSKDVTPGTPTAPSAFMPIATLNWNDKPTWLEDKALRSVMGDDAFNLIQGVGIGEIDLAGPVFGDELGYVIGNMFGDVTATGTAIAPTGTLSAPSIVGATTVSSSVSIPTTTLIQIDVGALAEIVTTTGVPTGAGPYTIPVPALTKPHASGVAITAVQTPGPLSHQFALLNTLSGQPTSHTITQYYGPEPTHNARQFSGTAFSDLTLTFNAETDMLMFSAKGMSWMSNIAAATPTPAFTAAKPMPTWQSLLGIGGPASGGTKVVSIYKGEFNFQRKLKPYFTAQNLQTPYIIQRGGLTCDFKLTYIAADESALTLMRNNTQPQVQFVLNNGLTLGNALGVQVDIQAGAFKVAKPNFGSEAIEFDVEGKAIFNSTNVGYSGGLGPATISLVNAITAGTYL